MDIREAIERLERSRSYAKTYGDENRNEVEALGMAIRALEKQAQSSLSRVYVCSPFRGDYDANTKNARFYSRHAALQLGVIPIVPHLLFPQFLDDTVPEERALGLRLGLELLKLCDELWVYGDRISEGMKAEIEFAKELGIPVRNGEKMTLVDGKLEEV